MQTDNSAGKSDAEEQKTREAAEILSLSSVVDPSSRSVQAPRDVMV
jgi:hypothetical protein